MCTAVAFSNGHHYFGRNLDLEYSYQESVTVTPRCYPFSFRCGHTLKTHYAMIGIAYVADGYPLYYDATNEEGLSIAGLNFPGNAVYQPVPKHGMYMASFEVIPWLLGQCKTVQEAVNQLKQVVITDCAFSSELPAAPLHWLLADRNSVVCVESMENGLEIQENPVGILTNNPPFGYHMHHLAQYLNVTSAPAENRFAPHISLQPFSKGMGGLGLPGDLSSPSRFVRAAFVKENSICGQTESENVSQFFHILGSVEQQRGCAQVKDELYEITLYSSCCNTDTGVYYYRTYHNSQITAVHMQHENLDGTALLSYPLIVQQQFASQN